MRGGIERVVVEPLVTVALVRFGKEKPWKDDVVSRDTRESRRLSAGSRCPRLEIEYTALQHRVRGWGA